MKSSSKTLSVRVPLDVAQTIEKNCKSRGITRSTLLNEFISHKKEYILKSVKLFIGLVVLEFETRCALMVIMRRRKRRL